MILRLCGIFSEHHQQKWTCTSATAHTPKLETHEWNCQRENICWDWWQVWSSLSTLCRETSPSSCHLISTNAVKYRGYNFCDMSLRLLTRHSEARALPLLHCWHLLAVQRAKIWTNMGVAWVERVSRKPPFLRMSHLSFKQPSNVSPERLSLHEVKFEH